MWILLALPSWIARFVIRRERLNFKALEDLGVGACFLLFFQMVPYLPYLIVPLLQCLILGDAYLEQTLKIRLERHFFSFIPQWRSFMDSTSKGKLCMLALISLGSVAMPVSSVSPWWMGAVFLPLMTAWWGKDHLFVHLLKPPKKQKGETIDPAPYLAKSEVSKLLHPQFPLYRYTTGFQGEKAFDLKLSPRPNLVILFVESLAAHQLEKAPYLNRLKDEGIFFPQFYSNSFQTFRSLFATLYGLPYPPTQDYVLDATLPVVGLPQILKQEGYQIHAINGASWSLNNLRSFLKEQGVDFIADPREIQAHFPEAEGFSWGLFDSYLFNYTLDQMALHRNGPLCTILMTISTHHPFTLPKTLLQPQGSDYEKFLQTLSYSDQCIGDFIEALEDETFVMIMGDHGNTLSPSKESFLFPKESEKAAYHVPLILWKKGCQGQVVETIGSQADILPTLLDLLQIKAAHHSLGKSLLRKEKRSVFLYNPLNPYEDFQSLGGESTRDQQLLLHLFEEKRLSPHKKPEGLVHYEPSRGITEKALVAEIPKGCFSIDLSSQPYVTDHVLETLAQKSPTLGVLNLQGCPLVTNRGMEQIFSHCPELYSLNVSRCPLLTLECLRLKNLESLWMDELEGVDEHWLSQEKGSAKLMFLSMLNTTLRDVSKLQPLFPHLNTACFSYAQIDPESLLEFLKKEPVYRLDLYECGALTDAFFSKLHGVKALRLVDCHQLTDKAFQVPLSFHSLVLKHPTQLTDQGLKNLLEHPMFHLEIEGAVSLTQQGVDFARKCSEKYVHFHIDDLIQLG